MLREAIEKCPDEVWEGGTHPRNPWRIAFHALFYTHLYLMPNQEAFEPWAKNRKMCRVLWDDDEEPAPIEPAYSKAELIEYLQLVKENLDEWIDALDLEAPDCGIPWYDMPKLDHQLLTLRHLGIHLGQIQELVFAAGGDLNWVGVGTKI